MGRLAYIHMSVTSQNPAANAAGARLKLLVMWEESTYLLISIV